MSIRGCCRRCRSPRGGRGGHSGTLRYQQLTAVLSAACEPLKTTSICSDRPVPATPIQVFASARPRGRRERSPSCGAGANMLDRCPNAPTDHSDRQPRRIRSSARNEQVKVPDSPQDFRKGRPRQKIDSASEHGAISCFCGGEWRKLGLTWRMQPGANHPCQGMKCGVHAGREQGV